MNRGFFVVCFACVGLAACQSIKEAQETDEALMEPINCATAEGDLRVLKSERAHVADETAAGATLVSPSSLYGFDDVAYSVIPSADQQESINMEIGRYQQAVDEKIAKIKATCGL